MMHNPIVLDTIGLNFLHKTCFTNFSYRIHYGARIGIIGHNGSGKSTLLKIIQGLVEPSTGAVAIPANAHFGYVPQIIESFSTLSGGQRFNKALTQALAQNPNVLCLDEPTNHLDTHNKKSLIQMLQRYQRTLIIVSHDVALLNSCIDELWNIDEGKITVFTGNYDAYLAVSNTAQQARMQQVEQLKKNKKKAHDAAQFEQQRAARGKRANKDEKDRLLKNKMKETASSTTGKKLGTLNVLQQQIEQSLQDLRLPESVKPNFNLNAADLASHKIIVAIEDGSCGYDHPILQHMHLALKATEHAAIQGDNGSGKSTLFKALLKNPQIKTTGQWIKPASDRIGYLDQHYSNLDPHASVLESLANSVSGWSIHDIRKHLNDFLFRKNEQVQAEVSTLSGGERARLSLALIAAQSPVLLLLDEITNNLDLQTREHVIQILQAYPGAMLIISHDQDFLEQIRVDRTYVIKDSALLEI